MLNIFVYRRISRNAEIYARWYLEDLPAVSYYVDKLVNEKKMSKIDAAIQKNKCMKRIDRNLLLAKYFDYLAWIFMALLAITIITLSILKHCLFFSKVFIYFEIAIAILIIVAYISTVLALHRLGLKEVPELPKVRISDNSSLGKFDYKLNCKGEEIITRTFSNDLTEENIEQIRTDIIKAYNAK